MSDTRWSRFYESIKGVLMTLKPTVNTLEAVAEGCHARRTVDARGILSQVRSIQFVLLLEVFVKVFAVTHALSEQLQQDLSV